MGPPHILRTSIIMQKSNIFNKVTIEFEDKYQSTENFAELYGKSFNRQVTENTITKGEIIAIENDVVIVDIGAKNEGVIPLKEFLDHGESPNIGDVYDIYVEKIESRNGNTILSRDKALKEEYWVVLEKALTENTNVDGVIFGKVKGGFTVDLQGIIAFLPGSQVDVRPIKNISPLMGIVQPFKILKMDKKQGNIVVSRRSILEETRDEDREEVLSSIKEGQVLEGVVKNITDYGAFIDLGSVDGLLHVTDISWGRINHPSEVLTLGQTVNVKVTKFNEETRRISLGMKQLEDNPWKDIEARYPKGQKFAGKITNITDYGVFVALEPGIEGLVHVSEIAWGKSNVHPKKLVNLNQEVEFIILEIDPAKHRISLGMKQCNDNPWINFADKHPVGTIVEGNIKNIVDFGVFIGFEGDIDGLIHVSDISWYEEDALEQLKEFKKDQIIKAKVLTIEADKERISLGIKQLSEEPKDTSASTFEKYKVGEVITAEVKDISAAGISLILDDASIAGFIKTSELSATRGDQTTAKFAIGEKVTAKVISANKSKKQVNLSIKALEIDEKNQAIKEYGNTESGASLGDILGVALNQVNKDKK
jgi:small subunit ribosomal protein S1